MYIADVEKIIPHGGSIKVTARNVESFENPNDRVGLLLNEEASGLTLERLSGFKNEVEKNIKAFREILEGYKESGLKVAGYGAPARVATITNYGQIGPSLVDFIVDDSPLKQDRFSPGMHIPIVPKSYLDEHAPDILVVFAYEYFDDIKKKTGGNFRYLIPIPPREIK